MLKSWNHSTTTRSYAVTYYKNLEKVPWHLGPKTQKWQQLSKSLKRIVKISIILRVFSDRLFLGSHGGRGCTGGAVGEGGFRGKEWGGGQQRGGGVGAIVGGSTVGVFNI